jgi:lysophospholipase L1-like esterase
MKKAMLYLIIFVAIGEIMIRFDESFTLLSENRIVKIPTDIVITPEFDLVKKGNFPNNPNDLRIMVIGDSYIHGGGIEFDNNFSQQLKKMLLAKKLTFDNIWVLDVSKSSSNNLDNNQTYFQFVDKFNPNIVIIGYNLNDIDGNLEKPKEGRINIENFNKNNPSGRKAQSTIRKINKIIYQSKFIHFIFKKTHSYLKTFGIIIPNSRFDFTMKSYYQNKSNWKKSKALLSEIIEDTLEKQIQLIVYKFPEVNLLEYPKLFSKANESIKLYFDNYPSVIYANGSETLKGEKSDEYILSKYDGHPNEKAHKKMAEDVFNVITKNKN